MQKSQVVKKIKDAMIEKAMNQSDLAKKIKTDRAEVSNLIRGKKNVSLKRLKKISEAVDKPFSYFLDNSNGNVSKTNSLNIVKGTNNKNISQTVNAGDNEFLRKVNALQKKEIELLKKELEIMKLKLHK